MREPVVRHATRPVASAKTGCIRACGAPAGTGTMQPARSYPIRIARKSLTLVSVGPLTTLSPSA